MSGRPIFRSWAGVRHFAVAVGLVGLDVTLFSRLTEDPEYTSWVTYPVNIVLVVLTSAPMVPMLLYRRRSPVAASLGLAAYAAVLTALVGTRPVLSLAVALYTVSAWRPQQTAALCLAATLAAHGLAVAYEAYPLDPADRMQDAFLVASVLVLCDVAAWAAGRWSAAARAQTEQLEASREAASAAAVAAERLRIGRELHDIVAHAVTVMVLQAAGAQKVLSTEPTRAREAMQAVQEMGKQAMVELRRLLEVLRSVGDTEDVVDSGPAPGLSRIPELAQQVRSAGVAVQIESQGDRVRLDRSVELTAYRILQEALTNVTRHAGPGSAASVRLQWQDGTVALEVTDDGAGTPQLAARGMSTGLGLVGLRERVKVIGGELEAGALSGGGYRLTATLPAEGATAPMGAREDR